MVRLLARCLPMICMPRKKRQSLPIGEQQTNGTKHHQEEVNKLFVRRVESIRVTQQGGVMKHIPSQMINERHHQQQKKTSRKSKAALSNGEKIIKADDTEFDCETHISDRRSKRKNRIKPKKKPSSSKPNSIDKTNPPSRSRTPLEKLFPKSKKARTPSPTPSHVLDIPEEEHNDATSSISSSSSSSLSSEWSTTTYPDSQSSGKSEELLPSTRHRRSMPVANTSNESQQTKHRSCVESFYLGREHVPQSPARAKKSLSKVKEENNKKKKSSQEQRNDTKPSAKSKQVLQNVRKMMKDQGVQEQHFQGARRRESVRL